MSYSYSTVQLQLHITTRYHTCQRVQYAKSSCVPRHDSAWHPSCHATDGSPKIGLPGPSAAKYVAVDGPPGTKYGCHRWSPRTICGAVSGAP